MHTVRLSLLAQATGVGLALTCRVDGQVQHCTPLGPEPEIIEISLPDQDGAHTLELELSGKLPDHTMIDEHGIILSDTVAKISLVRMDDIELGHAFYQNCEYLHDHNGTTDPLRDEFFGIMGCNGTVRFHFTAPIYLWLLDHM